MLPSSSMSASSRFCFNTECSVFTLDHYRPGWRLRSGDFADLCDRCASAYEQGKFCDVFHLKASGWRCCESCGKRIHCGCIVAASAYILLDAGGIECLVCARKKASLGPNFSPSPSFRFQSPISEKFRDLSINWSSSNVSNQISIQPPSLLGPSVLQFDMHNRIDSYEFSQPTSKDKATTCSMEKNRGMNDLMGKLMSENSKNCKLPPCPDFNVYHPLISVKEGPCGTQLSFPVPITKPIKKTGHLRLDASNLWHSPISSPMCRIHNDINGGADSPFESTSQSLRTHLDKPAKCQVDPQYWPKVSYKHQVLENQSNESESVVTPLFEKMLSASDTGKIGRLVLPKKCAEAFFPRISQTEGVPLKVQDTMGKEWTFQFRFWPNNNSRMYVLEGVTPCIQSMRLQAGDTVIFSRLDPERKLIMGFRKASTAQASDQETDATNNNCVTCTKGDGELADTDSPSKVKKSTYIAKETPGVDFSCGKKKGSNMFTRSKRLKVEKGDLTKLKLTCEEAQGFLLPPPNLTPSRVVIEECEFEEYEDAPIIWKPTACATDDTGFRSTCTADQELVPEEQDEEASEEVEGHSMLPKTTTKHPRHRSGCTCIVCIQSPSGKGPKHDKCCPCTVCETVKRRRLSLLLRREKKQLEKEDKAHKDLEQLKSDEEFHESANNSNNHEHDTSPLIGQIDLNFQPAKDEESLPGSNTTNKNKPLHHDDTVRSIYKPLSSSSTSTQIDKEEEEKVKICTEVADTTTSS